MWKIDLKYIIIIIIIITIIRNFYNFFIFFSVPSDFIPFCALLKTFLARFSPPTVTTITNTHCHSQHSFLLPFYQHPFSYIICSKSGHFH